MKTEEPESLVGVVATLPEEVVEVVEEGRLLQKEVVEADCIEGYKDDDCCILVEEEDKD